MSEVVCKDLEISSQMIPHDQIESNLIFFRLVSSQLKVKSENKLVSVGYVSHLDELLPH